MGSLLSIDVAREYFVNAILKSGAVVPGTADISLRLAINGATAYHCDWPLGEKGPSSRKRSREITVQIDSDAMNCFRPADAKERGEMLSKFVQVLNGRLLDEQYDEQAPPSPALVVHIDRYSLAS
jgi:hypothetical protein